MHTETAVYNSRSTTKLNNVWRRRRCEACHKTFTTSEYVEPGSIIHVKSGKHSQPFSQAKLLISLYRVCDHLDKPEDTAYHLTQTIMQKLYKLAAKQAGSVFAADITTTTLTTLKNYNLAAYIKYLSYHSPQLDTRALKKRLRNTTS